MQSLERRITELESATQPGSPYTMPLMPGCKRLSILVLRGPDEQEELERVRARGFVAELDTPESDERFLG